MFAALSYSDLRRQVVSRIAIKKTYWLEKKSNVVRRHHGIVFGAGNVGVAEGVPQHHIGIFDRAIGLHPGGKAVIGQALIRKIAGGEVLVFSVGSDPDMMIHEAGTFAPPGVW